MSQNGPSFEAAFVLQCSGWSSTRTCFNVFDQEDRVFQLIEPSGEKRFSNVKRSYVGFEDTDVCTLGWKKHFRFGGSQNNPDFFSGNADLQRRPEFWAFQTCFWGAKSVGKNPNQTLHWCFCDRCPILHIFSSCSLSDRITGSTRSLQRIQWILLDSFVFVERCR